MDKKWIKYYAFSPLQLLIEKSDCKYYIQAKIKNETKACLNQVHTQSLFHVILKFAPKNLYILNKLLDIQRFPPSTNKSLKAWSAADEYLVEHFKEVRDECATIAIINDRFGYLTLHTHDKNPHVLIAKVGRSLAMESIVTKQNAFCAYMRNTP